MLGKVLNAVPVTQQALDKWDSDDLISLGISVWQAHSAMAGWWLWWAALFSPVCITYPQGSNTSLNIPFGTQHMPAHTQPAYVCPSSTTKLHNRNSSISEMYPANVTEHLPPKALHKGPGV